MEGIKLFGVFIPNPPSECSTINLSSSLPQPLDATPLSWAPPIGRRLVNPVEGIPVKPKKKMIKRPRLRAPQPQPLPQVYLDFLVNRGLYANSLTLIFTKALHETDLSKGHARLSMPRKQVREGFLNPYEEGEIRKSVLDGKRVVKKKIDVEVVDPKLNIRTMKLARWNDGVVEDKKRKKSWWYALTCDWIALAKDNALAVRDGIQVWSFRTKEGGLGFVIHKLDQIVVPDGSGSSNA